MGCGSLAEDALQSPGMSEGSSLLKTVIGKGSIRTLTPTLILNKALMLNQIYGSI